MIHLYCPQGHENPAGSRFCLHCGNKLDLQLTNGISAGLLLGDRYFIIRQLAQGGFGRTYLAEDTNRFSELCVLKEFAPQAQSTEILQKAEELFEREAGVLYKLQHPQIPRFRELFRVNLDGKGYLFLVQDYVEGETYRALLDTRIQQGKQFSEAEVMHLLLQILPVLDYIHSMRVIHRDISPENLILRSSDQLPMLIDFGGVKQVAVTVVSQFNHSGSGSAISSVTLLGKVGYAPHEQLQKGMVYPHSDLYALAATVLVLLTGKEPPELIDEHTLTWQWRREVNLSPMLGTLLDKMLSPQLGTRYQSAWQVLQVLNSNNTATQPSTPRTQATLAIAPSLVSNTQTSATVASPAPNKISSSLFPLGKILLMVPLLAGAAGVGWWAVNWLQFQSTLFKGERTEKTAKSSSNPAASPQFSAVEQKRKNQLRDRRQHLAINNKFYIQLVNQAFWDKYPNQRGRNLSVTPEDAELRAEWDNIAAKLLDQLQPLSRESRQRLGSYTAKERDRWRMEVNKLNLSSQALYDLADAAFFERFPQQQGKNFMNQPIAQVWYALAAEKLDALIAGNAFERIGFDSEAIDKRVSGNLKPGEGKAYIAELAKQQVMKLDLQANPQVLISVYSPTGKNVLMEDSNDRTWSGTLPEAGFYEFVVVSTASKPMDYQLNITTENHTPPDAATPAPSETGV